MDDVAEARWRGLLEDEEERTRERLGALERQLASIVQTAQLEATDDEHDPEGATIAFERAQVTALRDDAVATLEELRAARQRLDDGTFGRCERCGRDIAPQRLTVLPTARRCVECADKP